MRPAVRYLAAVLALALGTLSGCSERPAAPADSTAERPRGMPPELQLVMLHVGWNDQIRQHGLVGALPAYADSTSWLLWPALPALRGVAPIQAALAAQPGLDSTRFVFDPLHIEVAPDTSLALLYGAVAWDNPVTGSFRIGRYLMAWRRDAGAWRLDAAAVVNLVDPREVVPLTASPPAWSALEATGPAADFVAADLAFADSASRSTAASAFRHWAAPDGVTFASTGPLQRGPEAIGTALERLDNTRWQWHPIGAGASADGTLGWTVGEAVILVPQANGGAQTVRNKYLSLWQRQADGSIRFIADGGNAAP